jgi:hypothetical protein
MPGFAALCAGLQRRRIEVAQGVIVGRTDRELIVSGAFVSVAFTT